MKRVWFEDGTYMDVENGVTWEYENDPDWVKTDSLNEMGFWCDKSEDGSIPAKCDSVGNMASGTSYCYKECEFHASGLPK